MKRNRRIAALALVASMTLTSAFATGMTRAETGAMASDSESVIEEDFRAEETMTFVGLEGETYTTGQGKATVVLFGHTNCYYCEQTAEEIGKSDLIKSDDVQFVFADMQGEDIATLKSFRTWIGADKIMFCSDDNSVMGSNQGKMWSIVSESLVTTPVIAFYNKAGDFLCYTTGYQSCSAIKSILGDEVTIPKEEAKLAAPQSLGVKVRENVITKLFWQEVDGAQGYQIYRSLNKKSDFSMVAHTTKTEFEDSMLDSETTYYYKVRAYATVDGKVIYGEYSMTMGVTTGEITDPTPVPTTSTPAPTKKATVTPTKKATVSPAKKATVTPTKKVTAAPTKKATTAPTKKPTPTITNRPTSLAAPGSVAANPASATTVNINWKAAAGTSFVEVWRTTKANAEQKDYVCIGIYNAKDGASVSKLLTPNKTYYYKARGYIKFSDGKKVYSGYSKVVSATPKLSIPTPSGLKVTATTQNTVSLSWSKVSGENIMYEVWRMDIAGKTPGVCIGRYDTTSCISKKLISGRTYYYRVRAYFYYYGTDGQVHRVYGNYTPIVSGKTK